MRIDEVTGGSLMERPMGTLAKMGNKIAGKLAPTTAMRARAQGKEKAGNAANQLYKYYFQQLGGQNEKPTTDNIRNFLKQYKVPDNVIDQALQKAGVQESVQEQEPQQQELPFGDTEQQQQSDQTGEKRINKKQIQTVFNFVMTKHKPFAQGSDQKAAGNLPKDVLKAVGDLNDKQKAALAQALGDD